MKVPKYFFKQTSILQTYDDTGNYFHDDNGTYFYDEKATLST